MQLKCQVALIKKEIFLGGFYQIEQCENLQELELHYNRLRQH